MAYDDDHPEKQQLNMHGRGQSQTFAEAVTYRKQHELTGDEIGMNLRPQ